MQGDKACENDPMDALIFRTWQSQHLWGCWAVRC